MREYHKCFPHMIFTGNGVGCNKTSEQCFASGGPDSCVRYNDAQMSTFRKL